MEYCNSYNHGMAYHHHSQQHSHEFRCGMMKIGYNNSYNNLYGHNQHISWNGMHHPHQQQHQHQHHNHHQYGNRNISAACHYDSYKGNVAQNCFQSATAYSAANFDSPYEPTTNATIPPSAMYRSRFGGNASGSGSGYHQMCDVQQCFPNGGDNHRHSEFMPLNSGMSRCIDPLANSNLGASDPRNHQSYGGHETIPHHPQSMRMPTNHRPYDAHHQKPPRPFDSDPPHQSWYGHGHSHNNASETINESNHHFYQYHHHTINNSNYNEYPQHSANQYSAGTPNGQLVTAKEDKAPKMHRDRSLSKLVAMNRRLETQMNESERIDQVHHDHFENFDYYTDYCETPDSITSSSQFTNNDCMMNSTSDTDNNNNINGAINNSHKNNCKEANNQQVANDSEWISTSSTSETEATTTTTAPTSGANSTPLPTATAATTITQSDALNESQVDNSCSKPSVSSDENVTKKSDLPSTKSPAKQNSNKKIVKSKKVTNENLMEKRRKRREKKSNTDFGQIRELKTDTIPLPGFQQAFGSTEIGRFSEIFFNASGSPIEIGLFESEADTLSPQPWEMGEEMGDSLEGPHFSMQANNTPLSYTESLGSTDSPTASNNSFFSELRASEF